MKFFANCIALFSLLFLAAGCGVSLESFVGENETSQAIDSLAKAHDEFAATLKTVQDADSAKKAIDKIDAQMLLVAERQNALIKLLEKKNAAAEFADKANQAALERFSKAAEKTLAEEKRLQLKRGLPLYFWKVVTARSFDVSEGSLRLAELWPSLSGGLNVPAARDHARNERKIVAKHGFEKVVYIEADPLDPNDAKDVADWLEKAVPQDVERYSFLGGADDPCRTHFIFSPCADMNTFLKTLKIGSVLFEDEGQRKIILSLDVKSLALAEEKRRHDEDVRRISGELERKFAAERNKLEEANKRVKQEIEEAGKKAKEDLKESAKKFAGDIAEGPNPLQRGGMPNRAEELTLPDETDPNYFERMADILNTNSRENFIQITNAADQLLVKDPSQVKSNKTRKKIFEGYSRLVNDPITESLGIRGLLKWNGDDGVKEAIRLIEESDSALRDSMLVIALGETKNPRTAPLLAKALSLSPRNGPAKRALRSIGPPAENSVLEIIPSLNPFEFTDAIEVLGDIGSARSLKLLRKAQWSRDPMVQESVKNAIARILERQKEIDSQKKKSSENPAKTEKNVDKHVARD